MYLNPVFMVYQTLSNANILRKVSERWISSDVEKRKTQNQSSPGWNVCGDRKILLKGFMVLDGIVFAQYFCSHLSPLLSVCPCLSIISY